MTRMVERGVEPGEALRALEEPVEIAYDKSRDVYVALGANGVAVVYAQRGAYYEIVTVMREVEYRNLVYRIGRRRYRIVYTAP